jgi:hypothetical protein
MVGFNTGMLSRGRRLSGGQSKVDRPPGFWFLTQVYRVMGWTSPSR